MFSSSVEIDIKDTKHTTQHRVRVRIWKLVANEQAQDLDTTTHQEFNQQSKKSICKVTNVNKLLIDCSYRCGVL